MHKYVLVTGATSGIGKVAAEFLAREGYNLILLARREQKLKEIQDDILSKYKIDIKTYKVDLTDIDQIEVFFNSISELELVALVNNAGLALDKMPIGEYDWLDCCTMIDTNIKGFLRVAQLSIPSLQRNQGHIVNISSIAGIEAYEGGSIYCATKAFVKSISKSLRIDLAGTGIRVTDIAPGSVDTNFSKVRFKGNDEKSASVYKGYEPLHADDIANCIIFSLKQPQHVNVEYMLVMPTAQASATRFSKDS